MSIVDVAKETLYCKYDNPFVIINEHSKIKEVHGSLRLYLEISQGIMNVNLHKMVNPELVTVTKAVLAQVKKTNVTHTSHVVKFMLSEQLHYVCIKVIPLLYRINKMRYYIVIFDKVEPSEGHIELQKKLETSDFVNIRINELGDKLTYTEEPLQVFTEELKATNGELQTINKELQFSNEELKSSNEELQSANEELNTTNKKLRLTNNLLIEKEQELKKEKELSQRNELIYKTIVENLPGGAVGILNKDLEIEYLAGQGVDEMSIDKLLGKHLPSLNPSKKEAKRIEELCKETLKGNSGSIEVKYNNQYYEIKTERFKLPHRDENRVLYLAQEITSLKQNQLILKTALKALNLIVFQYDFEKDELQYDDQLYKFLELNPKKKITEEDIIEKIHPEDVTIRMDNMKKAKKTGQIYHEIRLKLKKGTKYIRVTGTILLDEKKKPKKGYATILDITQDKTLLQQITQSEERFKKIADTTPMTIWITNKDAKCTYINKTWLNYTGSTLKDNLGDDWLKFLHKEDKDMAMGEYMMAFNKRIPYSIKFRIRKHDGTYQWFLNHGIPKFDINNNFEGYLGSNTNIQDQVAFSEALEEKVEQRTKEITKANKELIKLNMNLEEFAYMASHDLKEPLRKIRTFNSIIVSKEADRKSISAYGLKIEQSAKRMTDLIDNILEYSRIEENSIKTEKVVLDDTLDQVLSDLTIMLEDQEVKVHTEDLGKIKGIPIRIYQLFSNLIKNAIKFNTNKPIIEISTSEIQGKMIPKRFNANQKIDFKKIVFKDNGIGLNENKKEYIFKPFKKLNSSSDYIGTGIGLAISRRIMDLHDGYIDVESKKGKGSSFILYFPVKK